MATPNGTAAMESKAAKKRKAKADAAGIASSEGSALPAVGTPQAAASKQDLPSGVDGPSESNYLKELNR